MDRFSGRWLQLCNRPSCDVFKQGYDEPRPPEWGSLTGGGRGSD